MTKQPEAREPDQPLALSSSAVLGPLPPERELYWDSNGGAIIEGFDADDMEAERQRCYALGVAAGIAQEHNRCRYPQCVENEDERCPRWLTGECEGPNGQVKAAGRRPVAP